MYRFKYEILYLVVCHVILIQKLALQRDEKKQEQNSEERWPTDHSVHKIGHYNGFYRSYPEVMEKNDSNIKTVDVVTQ